MHSSSFAHLQSHWTGYATLKRIVIFGDSYSAVGYDRRSCPLPSYDYPLGIEFPGSTWASMFGDRPSWPGYLTRDFSPNDEEPLLIHSYAVGGAKIDDVAKQVRIEFLPYVGTKPEGATWSAEDTLFVIWIGINDCAFSREHDGTMDTIFDLHQELYDAGARNFLLIDLPPIHRTPAVPEIGSIAEGTETNMQSYNHQLRNLVDRLAATHLADRSSILYFSAWDVFNEILDHPKLHGFVPSDLRNAGGKIWWDRLHPTHTVHEIFAAELVAFLNEQPAFGQQIDGT